jgi:negative regulator of sigma E activity
MTTEPSKTVTPQDLSAYFDEELTAEQAEVVALALAEDPQLHSEHAQLGMLGGVLRSALEAEAEAVPAARFEQIWDEIDRAIERDARLQAGANRNASIWTRLWAALRPVRVPVLAAAAAAAVAIVVLGRGAGEPNNPESTPSVAEAPQPTLAPAEAPVVAPAPPDRLAIKGPAEPAPSNTDAKLPPMPVPQSNEAEIHGIEFGGKQGRISHTGTVTVLYVEEDETPPNSERSL